MSEKKIFYMDKEFQYGMHACGFIYDLMFTNSLDSVLYWYERNVKIFEIDIDMTPDGEFVACHNFVRDTFSKMEIDNIPDKPTSDWFKKQKLYVNTTPGLTTMTLEDVFKLSKRYEDMIFMIDPKVYTYEEVCLLLEKIKQYIDVFQVDGKRIIFETYNKDMIMATRNYVRMVQYQYCVDDEMQMGTSEEIRSWELERLIPFLKENEIWILSYPWKFAVESLERVKKLHDEGFFIFSKTRNDILADLLEKAGINVNIIDHLVTEEQREELKEYRQEYEKEYADKIEEVFA